MTMTPEVDFLLQDFEQRQSTGEGEALQALRRQAIDAFTQLGFPTTKSEEYRYTNVAPIANAKLPTRHSSGAIDALPASVASFDCAARVVLVDGQLNVGLSQLDSIPDGVRIRALDDALSDEAVQTRLAKSETLNKNGFYALNAAFARSGVVIEVANNVAVAEPIRVIHVSTDTAAGTAGHIRHLLSLGRHAELTVVEEFVSLTDASYFTNVVREVELDDGAQLRCVEVIRESPQAFHIGSLSARIPRDARVQQIGLTLTGALVRREAHVELAGEGADATLAGVYAPTGRE
ncbi:MAG: SufD family Fe-S cluster assembly protein, partial [Myxococcota bacterium]